MRRPPMPSTRFVRMGEKRATHPSLQNGADDFLQVHHHVPNNKKGMVMSTTNIPVFNDTSDTIQRPQWLDEQLYPFQSHFVEIEGNHIHYIDEGSGPTLLLLHPGV